MRGTDNRGNPARHVHYINETYKIMKKTLFFTMLAAALVGGQVFAADAIPTEVGGYNDHSGNNYYGKKNNSGEANGANVTVSYSETGSDLNRANVYGGSASTEASNNKITMTGGQVLSLYGAEGKTTVSKNTVIMTGGKVTSTLRGGHSTENKTELVTPLAEKNVVIVAGDCELNTVYGGYSSHGDAKDNKVYLVGKGATATIADAQGSTSKYTGGNITLKSVNAGDGDGTLDNNSIDIYGTGITASGQVTKMQILNFHISQNQIGGEYANVSMLTCTGTSNLALSDVAIGIQDVDVQSWTPGTAVTLVQMDKKTIKGIESGQEVDIMRGNQVVAKGQLVLSNDNMTLSLSIPGSVPEPTTGTLGLLALAGLCIRRRK